MITAELKNHRQAPRKMRLVTNAVRGKMVSSALNTLAFIPKKASLPITKLIKSAVANASHNFKMGAENLYIKEITVNGGPILKRSMPRARGRAFPIHKHTSHIRVVLAEKGAKALPAKSEATEKVVAKKAPVKKAKKINKK